MQLLFLTLRETRTRFNRSISILLVGTLLAITSAFQATQAQVITQRFAAGAKARPSGPIPTLTLPPIDLTNYLLEDAQRTKDQHPFRFGANIPVNIDLLTVASRTDTPTERIYRYELHSAGAYSLNLILDQLQLTPGAQLYLYDPTVTMQIGPITNVQNTQTNEFWSDLLQGDRLILELREPVGSSTSSQVHLRSVVHGYRNVFPTGEKINESGSCEVNMACYPAHQFEGDGVVVILTQDGSAYCTGSILNDSRQSFRSFLLSANHCGVTDNSLIRFNYQSPACTPTTAPVQTLTMNGSDFRANYANSDFSLRELKSQIPAEANVTYLGWSRTDANVSNAFGIHHPEGDVKKISFTNADTQISGYYTTGANHLHAYWDTRGVTEPGSSGSPLFDGNGRIIGQLHGGPSTCSTTGTNRSDYYGRIFSSWTGGGANTNRLSNWLDPTDRGNLTTDGVKPRLSGLTTVTNVGSFSINTLETSIASWSIAGGTGLVSTTVGTGNMANLTVLSSAKSLTITFSVSTGQSYPIQFSQIFDVVRSCPSSVRYVRAGATGNGCSWETASGNLQAMINTNGAQQIRVAAGLYKPTASTDRTASFSITSGIQLYGGYVGTGANADTRVSFPFSTTLSGEIGAASNADNSYHVVYMRNAGTDTRLDGLVITGGNANDDFPNQGGGGLYNESTADGNSSNPTLINVWFAGNSARLGGALYNYGTLSGNASPRLTNVSFSSNSATSGGAIYNQGPSAGSTAKLSLVNVSFGYNSASAGGAICLDGAGAALNLINGIVFGNGAPNSFSLANGASVASIFVRYSLLESSISASSYSDGSNNRTTSTSPFVSTTDLQLNRSSVAANGGSNAEYTAVNGPSTDLAGNLRIQNDRIDMGAYESTLPADLTLLLYARPSTQYANTIGSVVIDLTEINSTATNGIIVVRISKDSQLGLNFNPNLTTVGERVVQNSQWSFSNTDADYYVLTTSQPIAAGDKLSVGLQSKLNSSGTTGALTVSATVVGGSGGEIKVTNNIDADKIDYFQQ